MVAAGPRSDERGALGPVTVALGEGAGILRAGLHVGAAGGGIAGAAAGIAKILFIGFIILAAVVLIASLARGRTV